MDFKKGELNVVQIDGECMAEVLYPVDSPTESLLQFMSNSGISVETLKAMTKDDANRLLSPVDKLRWVELHNATANCYFIKKDRIEDVPPAGWWR